MSGRASIHSFPVPISRLPLPKILRKPMTPVSLKRTQLIPEKSSIMGEEFTFCMAGNTTLSAQHQAQSETQVNQLTGVS